MSKFKLVTFHTLCIVFESKKIFILSTEASFVFLVLDRAVANTFHSGDLGVIANCGKVVFILLKNIFLMISEISEYLDSSNLNFTNFRQKIVSLHHNANPGSVKCGDGFQTD